MKKVFLSVPMRDRIKENIEKSLEKMKAIIKLSLGEDVEFINTLVETKPPYKTNNEAMWYLGKSIQLLSQADILVSVETPYWMETKGVEMEKQTWLTYAMKNESRESEKYIMLPLLLVMDEKEYNELYEKRFGDCCEEELRKVDTL